jgi:nitrogen fixation protein FixH
MNEKAADMHAEHAAPAGRPLTGRTVLIVFLAFFGVVFSMNFLMLRLATGTFGGVETDSSYRASQRFNLEAQAAAEQASRGWTVDAAVTRLDDEATVTVVTRDAQGRAIEGLEGTVRLARPADRRLDRSGELSSLRGGRYEAVLAGVPAGQWDAVITLERDGERVFLSRSRLVLR